MNKIKHIYVRTPCECILIAIISEKSNKKPSYYVRKFFRKKFKRHTQWIWNECNQHKLYWIDEKTNIYENYIKNTPKEDRLNSMEYHMYKRLFDKKYDRKHINFLYEENSKEKINLYIWREFLDNWKRNEIDIHEFELDKYLGEETYCE